MPVTKACQVPFRVQNMDYGVLDIPAGLRVKLIAEGGTKGKFFLDQFPASIFPSGSFIRHDAVHYGVVLDPDQVTGD